MAKSKGSPLGIGLGIDFAQLDSDLSKVADKIDRVGSKTTVKVGSLGALASKGGGLPGGGMDPDQLAAQVAKVGVSLSQGMQVGVGQTNAMLLSMASRMNSTLESLASTVTTMFKRIDAAMKFPMFRTAIQAAENRFSSFFKTGKTYMSDLDKASAGSFGQIAQTATKILIPLFEQLGVTMGKEMAAGINLLIPIVKQTASTIATSMANASMSMAASMETAIRKLSSDFKGLGRVIIDVIADANQLGATVSKGKYQKFGKFPEKPVKMKSLVEEEPVRTDRTIQITKATSIEKGRKTRRVARVPSDIGTTAASQEAMFEPAPQKKEFRGVRPTPQMGAVAAGMFKDAIASAKQFAKAVEDVGGFMKLINKQFGLWGRAITLPIQGLGLMGEVATRVTSGIIAGGLGVIRNFMRMSNFISSLGSVHKTTFAQIFTDHGKFAGVMLGSVKIVTHLVRGLWDLVTLRAFRRVADDAGKAKTSIGAVGGAVGKLTGSVGRLGAEILAAFGVIGIVYKAVEFFKKGTSAATELNSAVARSKLVFGDSFAVVEESAAKTEKAFNITKGSQLELASEFGSVAQGAGIGQKAAADMSNQLVGLATDMTGVGISFEEASEAMKTGLSGRAISMKQFAVQIDENTTKAYAWSHGIAQTGRDLSAQQTVAARAGQVIEGLSYVQGALAANAGKASVQFAMAGGGMSVFAEKIGTMMLPVTNMAVKGFNELMGTVLDLVDRSGPAISSWAADGVGLITTFIAKIKEFGPTVVTNVMWAWEEAKKGPLSFVITGVEAIASFAKAIPEGIGIAVRHVGDLWEIAKLQTGAFVQNAIAWVGTLPTNFGRIWEWLGKNWRELLIDMMNATKTFFINVGVNAKNFGVAFWDALKGKGFDFKWTGLLEGFKATAEQLPEMIKPALVSVDDQVKKIYEKIGNEELAVPKFKLPTEPETKGPGIKPPAEIAKGTEYKLGGALEAGSKEAFSAISRGMTGRDSTTSAVKQGIVVQKDIHKEIKGQTEVLKRMQYWLPKLDTK